jgi:hypothetical protein
VDEEREVSRKYSYSDRRNYQAEMDADLEPLPYEEEEERSPRPRIRGSRDDWSERDDYYEDQSPRRPERRSSSNRDRSEPSERRRRTSSTRPTTRVNDNYEPENWGSFAPSEDSWGNSEDEVRRSPRRGGSKPKSSENFEENVPPRTRRRSPNVNSVPARESDDEVISTDYFPYNPIEDPQDKPNDHDEF